MSKPKQGAPKTEEPRGEKRYKVLRLKAVPEDRIADRGFGILDNRYDRLVADEFKTPEEASAYVDEHLTPKTKPKLKTMNDISAAEAAKILHCARNFDSDGDPMEDYCLRPEYFPQDISARDFLECLELYSNMNMWTHGAVGDRFYDEQMAELREVAANIPEEDLKELSDAERKVFDVFRDNPGISNKEMGGKLNLSEDTIKTHFRNICDKLEIKAGRGRRRGLAAKYPPRMR